MRSGSRGGMFLFYFSITLAIASSALYHFTQKQIPAGVNPAVSVIMTYLASLGLSLALLAFLWPRVGLEVGFLLVYRSGWNIGIAAVLVNVVASLILVPVALFVFRQSLTPINLAGIVVCLAGLVMLNWKS